MIYLVKRIPTAEGQSVLGRPLSKPCNDLLVDHSDDDPDGQHAEDRVTTRNIGQLSRGVQKKKSRVAMNVEAVSALQTIAESIKLASTTKSSKSKSSPDMMLACMDVLNGMELPDSIYCPACTMFSEDQNKTKIFFNMPPHRQHNWLCDVLTTRVHHRPASASFPPRMGSNTFNVAPPSDPFGRQSSGNMFDIPPPGSFF